MKLKHIIFARTISLFGTSHESLSIDAPAMVRRQLSMEHKAGLIHIRAVGLKGEAFYVVVPINNVLKMEPIEE